ncbi:MAG: FAD-binding protein, partial [Cyanobium sp.]
MEPGNGAQPSGLRQAITLAEYTTWKVGGPAEWFAEPAGEAELIALAAWALAQGMPFRCIGAGSNMLIADDGLEGLTLCNRRLQGSRLDRTEGWVEAEAGEPIPTLARKAARAGLTGLEWAVGIPGTVGGAAVMNAGAQGGCTAEWLDSVLVIDPLRPETPFRLQVGELDFA